MNKITIIVSGELDEETGKLIVTVNSEPNAIEISKAGHLLISGVACLIKATSKANFGVKDYELIEELVEHLNSEFVSNESFEDIKIKLIPRQ